MTHIHTRAPSMNVGAVKLRAQRCVDVTDTVYAAPAVGSKKLAARSLVSVLA
jgi:hypothetical protein